MNGKKPNECPVPTSNLAETDVSGPAVQAIIRALVDGHVSVTSTLAIDRPSTAPRQGRSIRAHSKR